MNETVIMYVMPLRTSEASIMVHFSLSESNSEEEKSSFILCVSDEVSENSEKMSSGVVNEY